MSFPMLLNAIIFKFDFHSLFNAIIFKFDFYLKDSILLLLKYFSKISKFVVIDIKYLRMAN